MRAPQQGVYTCNKPARWGWRVRLVCLPGACATPFAALLWWLPSLAFLNMQGREQASDASLHLCTYGHRRSGRGAAPARVLSRRGAQTMLRPSCTRGAAERRTSPRRGMRLPLCT
jgi:hypothetical protein